MTADFTGAFEEKSGDGVARERGGVAENADCCLGACKKKSSDGCHVIYKCIP